MATATITTTRQKTSRPSSQSWTATKNGGASAKVFDDPMRNVKSLYAPAARAFVQRDVALTHTLMEAAFAILNAHPIQLAAAQDSSVNLRRKWDVLRITLETTVYTSASPTFTPGSSSADAPISPDKLPASLRSILSTSPPDLVDSLVQRSLTLWAPQGYASAPSFLPVSIISALAFAAIKLDCAPAGRSLIETWLAQRGEVVANPDTLISPLVDITAEGYEKILDVYCLQILPRLGEWDYAMEFLKYEPELPIDKRKHIYTSLKTLHTEVMNPVTPAIRVSRSSSSSSPSTTTPSSTSSSPSPASSGTATPNGLINGAVKHRTTSSLSASSFSSQSSQQTIKASQHPNSIAQRMEGGMINGHSSLVHATNGSSTPPGVKSPSPSRSPRTHAQDVGSPMGTTSRPQRSRSDTGSSRTALPFLPPPSALSTSSHPGSSSSSPSSLRDRSQRPVGMIDVFRDWIARSLSLGGPRVSPQERMLRVAFIVMVALVPILAYIARLRRGVRAGVRPAPGKLIVARRGAAGGAGTVKWLWEALKDGVVMAGKGLV
ncbi:hypothetical protein DL93DRAFT_394445 [Clavulina sp. PMI_390]|nr:hypothetical protein DL93DRAFT_394445 [Clavulina sp. PMI_390]